MSEALFRIICEDLGDPQKKSGVHNYWRCPFHHEDTPSLYCKAGDEFYYCFGCGESGNVFTWLTKYRNLSAGEANRILQVGGSLLPAAVKKPVDPARNSSAENLQAAWREVIEVCAKQLWTSAGARARSYLNKRGLKDETLASPFWRVGFSTGQIIAGVWVEHGIVLPCFTNDRSLEVKQISYIKIRRNDSNPKYLKLKGGIGGVYGADLASSADILFLCEGELDCLLLAQRETLGGAGDLVGVATLGSANDRPDFARWGSWLCGFKQIFVCFDADSAGQAACQKWQNLSDRVRPAPLPQNPPAKDVTEFWMAGGNLAAWVMEILNQHNCF